MLIPHEYKIKTKTTFIVLNVWVGFLIIFKLASNYDLVNVPNLFLKTAFFS